MPSHHARLARQTGLLALLTFLPAHLARDRRLQVLPRPGYPLAEGAVTLLQLGPLFGDFAVGDGRLPDSVIDIDSQGQQPSFNDVLLAGPAGCIQLDDRLWVQGPIGAHERDQLGLGGAGRSRRHDPTDMGDLRYRHCSERADRRNPTHPGAAGSAAAVRLYGPCEMGYPQGRDRKRPRPYCADIWLASDSMSVQAPRAVLSRRPKRNSYCEANRYYRQHCSVIERL